MGRRMLGTGDILWVGECWVPGIFCGWEIAGYRGYFVGERLLGTGDILWVGECWVPGIF